jgi:putative ATP-dependent endonuclease of the OLD family
MALLQKGSSVDILESGGRATWKQQGTGSQRALFWSLLEIRSKLFQTISDLRQKDLRLKAIPVEMKKLAKEAKTLKQEKAIIFRMEKIKKLKQEFDKLKEPTEDSQFLPSYMLLIDEPEVALHPNAIRSAREHLYELARDAGWQVMLTTHSPSFVDPLEDHTTVVRLTREDNKPTPKSYRSDEVSFSTNGKENLKMLLRFDTSLAEAFFGSYPVIVEGDTEYAAFQKVIELYDAEYPVEKRPVLIRARGKYTIVLIVKIFKHFKIPFSVLHDSDSPFGKKGGKNNAWTANKMIMAHIIEARRSGLKVIHRVSIPEFERCHGLEEVEKEKPYNFQKQINESVPIQKTVKNMLDDLISKESTECLYKNSEEVLSKAVEEWAANSALKDTRFDFNKLAKSKK